METTAINGANSWIGYKGSEGINFKNDDDFSVWDSVRGPFAMTEEQKEEFEASLEKYRSENKKPPFPPHVITILSPQDIDFFSDEDFDWRKAILM